MFRQVINPYTLRQKEEKEIFMSTPPVKLSFPESVSADLCTSLLDNGMRYSVIKSSLTKPQQSSGPSLQVNASTLPEVIIELINSTAIWGSLAYVIISLIRKNKHKKITIKRDGVEIVVQGDDMESMMKAIEYAKNIEIIATDKK